MKTPAVIFGIVMSSFIVTSHLQCTPVSNDEEAIKSVINAETTAYFNRDSTLLFSFYTDDPITQSTWNSPKGSFGIYHGLKSIRKNFSEAFRKNPQPQKEPNVIRSDWYFRKLSNEWMWVNFNESFTTPEGKRYIAYETRIMKKENKAWKIAVMYALSDHGNGAELH